MVEPLSILAHMLGSKLLLLLITSRQTCLTLQSMLSSLNFLPILFSKNQLFLMTFNRLLDSTIEESVLRAGQVK